MNPQDLEQIETLGLRLAHAARKTAARCLPVLPWLRSLEPVMQRVTSLPVASTSRFERRESQDISAVDVVAPSDAARRGDLWNSWTPMQPRVRERLQGVVGAGSAAVRVHDDEAADRIARDRRADAVTVGQDVFFRRGRFQPQQAEGFALLAHEAAHVVQAMRPGAAWRRATEAGVQQDEKEASLLERHALGMRRTSAPDLPALSPDLRSASARGASADRQMSLALPSASSPAMRPMTAPADRSLENSPPGPPPLPEFERLRGEIYRDLMNQIRADFERGA